MSTTAHFSAPVISGDTPAQAHWANRAFAVAFGLALALIVFATLIRGGNRYVPLLALEWLGLLVCLAWGWGALLQGRWPAGWGKGLSRWGFAALAALPVWVLLLNALGASSATPLAGWAAALVGLPVAAMWLLGLSASPAQTRSLWLAWLWMALAQAAMGLMQLGGWEALRFGLESGEKLIGTYASKNTYSNLLVMAVPLAVYGLLAQGGNESGKGRSGRPWLWGGAWFVLLACISLSTSRTGIATGLLTALLSVGLLMPNRSSQGRGTGAGSKRGKRWVWLGAAALLAAVALTGGLEWLARFEGERLAADDAVRGLMREATWQGAMTHWPWGSGLGSYRWVFPAFHPAELGGYVIDMAHNDYLQLFMELGVVFVALAALVLALVARRLVQLVGKARGARRGAGGWAEADRLAVACVLGALATALHALVDYPLHIPANAMMAAFLLGVFLREPAQAPEVNAEANAQRRSSRIKQEG
ncbi:O-antigen ligase family protein [Hydrogenophaga sp. PAMC20947]|uniref:O-antigen ligase family protein n=1 Tax=Hydrogenophaga sp. PAMC20947 TaxID=2565558 RepID=UPI00109E23D5|nr:O-antigen ligase family protein [Hydrogenophaga sp. PAMC20947]QCB47780.1 hypothetical protein E5678_18140 [Hydrogenophaga sp. PAMC20947]